MTNTCIELTITSFNEINQKCDRIKSQHCWGLKALENKWVFNFDLKTPTD